MKDLNALFQAVADPTRRAILTLVAANAMTPGALAQHFNLTRQGVSKHIRVLSASQLLKEQVSGREIYYQLNAKRMKDLADWLRPFEKLWSQRFDQLDELLKKTKK